MPRALAPDSSHPSPPPPPARRAAGLARLGRRRWLAALLAGLAVLTLAPAAEAGPFYLFAKLGSTDAQVNAGSGIGAVLDGDDNSSGFGLGLKLGRYMVFQAEYHDLGNSPVFGAACPVGDPGCLALSLPVEADSTAVSVTVLPHLELTRRLSLYAKLGFVSWDTDISAVSDAGSEFLDSRSAEELVYGAGLRLAIPGPFGAFAEYERIADAFETVAIGATWGF